MDSDPMTVGDMSAIEQLDPSLRDGAIIIYDREVPIEVRNQIGDQPVRQGTTESVKIKILLIGTEQEPTLIRIELSSESDLFFHYVHVLDENSFRKIQDQQKLMIHFPDYSNVLIRMLNACIREPNTNMAIFLMHGDTDARLDFIQNMEYKFVELMSCVFERSSDEIVQHHITYRYNAMKQSLGTMQVRLQELNNLVKTKNPSLLLQLQKFQGSSLDGNSPMVHQPSNLSNSLQNKGVFNVTSTAWR